MICKDIWEYRLADTGVELAENRHIQNDFVVFIVYRDKPFSL